MANSCGHEFASRRAYGLLNEQQIEILDHLSNTMLAMQDYEEADQLQLTAIQLMERIYGADTMGVPPCAQERFEEAVQVAERMVELTVWPDGDLRTRQPATEIEVRSNSSG